MAIRKKLPTKIKKLLLEQARGGCFAHRISWHQRVEVEETASKKVLPLDMHHVKFVSAGGDDSPANLVPLCPLCHREIHQNGMLGREPATPANIHAAWELWLAIGALPLERTFGTEEPFLTIFIELPTYQLCPRFLVGADLPYQAARLALLEAVLNPLASADRHFAFPRPTSPVALSSWALSCDKLAPPPWNAIQAHRVLSLVRTPITLTSPLIITLAQGRRPVLDGNEEQRTI